MDKPRGKLQEIYLEESSPNCARILSTLTTSETKEDASGYRFYSDAGNNITALADPGKFVFTINVCRESMISCVKTMIMENLMNKPKDGELILTTYLCHAPSDLSNEDFNILINGRENPSILEQLKGRMSLREDSLSYVRIKVKRTGEAGYFLRLKLYHAEELFSEAVELRLEELSTLVLLLESNDFLRPIIALGDKGNKLEKLEDLFLQRFTKNNVQYYFWTALYLRMKRLGTIRSLWPTCGPAETASRQTNSGDDLVYLLKRAVDMGYPLSVLYSMLYCYNTSRGSPIGYAVSTLRSTYGE